MKNYWILVMTAFILAGADGVCAGSADAQTDTLDYLTNSIGMKMVRIAPGSFVMGQRQGGDFDERPVHKAAISKPFFMGVCEVTNAQYERFDPAHKQFRGRHGISGDDNEAVVYVSWDDAVAFCRWLSTRQGRTYRLPTEAEWEYACRAGTTTSFYTGDNLPRAYHKNQKQGWEPVAVKLGVAGAAANSFGLYDMHGNVEEWCRDWYGPYEAHDQVDPVGRVAGDFRIARGGSHGTTLAYLRSANRMATLPQDKHWMIGFRVVQAQPAATKPLPKEPAPLWARNVNSKPYAWPKTTALDKPHFKGPVEFVKIPANSNGPLYSQHNHCPAITVCPNGDLLTVWYSTNTERGRELTVVASRLRRGSDRWEPASVFWNGPDRNDHGNEVWWDGKDTIYHFNGLSSDATWGKLALVMRTSTDSGATWSPAQLINANHGLRNQVISGALQTRQGHIIVKCDAVTGGSGGTAIHISPDKGRTWNEPGAGRPRPDFAQGKSGAWIAGIHAGLVQLADDSLMALGRGNDINGRMPMSISKDMGKTWTYAASEFPPTNGGQRLVLMRLCEGPILFVGFTDSSRNLKEPKGMLFADASGRRRRVFGLFAALSFDEGKTWPVKKLITPGRDAATFDGGAWTRTFTLDATHAEPKGYLAATQSPDGMIHLISSKLYYRFNLAWLRTSAPAAAD